MKIKESENQLRFFYKNKNFQKENYVKSYKIPKSKSYKPHTRKEQGKSNQKNIPVS